MSTVIFGAGYLGNLLSQKIPGAKLVPIDICDRTAVAKVLKEAGARSVINCAGKTGKPNVDWCETHQTETMRANVEGAIALADVCQSLGVYLIHLGSGCIFYGASPSPGGWREDDFANPTSFYSRSKYAADLLLSKLDNTAIVRLRMPIGSAPSPRNLITKLAAYARVVDVENSVTIVDDLVNVLIELNERRPSGIFHATNPGAMRHRDLLALYKAKVDRKHKVELISEEELLGSGLIQKARSNCILSSERLAKLGIRMRPIEEALAKTMEAYGQAVSGGGGRG